MNAVWRIIKWPTIVLATLVVLVALLLAGFGAVMSRAPAHRAQLQAWLSERAKLDIQFAGIGARWRSYGPELVFDRAVIRSADKQRVLARAERGGVGFDLWAALRNGELKTGRFSLTGTELNLVRTLDGKFELVGQDDLPEFDRTKPWRLDLLPVGQLRVRKVRLKFQDLLAKRAATLLQDAAFDLKRDDRHIELEGRAVFAAALGKELLFKARTQGDLSDVTTLKWQAEVSSEQLDLAGWAAILPSDWIAPKSGAGSLTLSATFDGASLQTSNGTLQFVKVAFAPPVWTLPLPRADVLQLRDETGTVIAHEDGESAASAAVTAEPVYSRIGADFKVARSNEGWRADIGSLQLSRAGMEWRPSRADVTVNTLPDGGLRLTVGAELLVLENVWPLLAFLPENERNARLRALNAVGRINGLQVNFERDNASATPRYRFAANVAGIGVAALGKTPGFSSLSGKVEASESQGSFAIDSTDFSLAAPRVFRTPLPVDKLAGVIAWQRVEHAWKMQSAELNVGNADGHARAKFTLQVPDEGPPVIDLSADAADIKALAAPRYMPAGVMSVKTLNWLDHAFTAGRVVQAQLTLRGPLTRFPFRGGEGLFLIKSRIEGLTLDYQPGGWMPGTDIRVDAEFRNEGMTATAGAATVNGLQINTAFARFKDFKEAELELKASGSGDLHQALEYLQRSAAAPVLGDTFAALSGNGALQAQVELRLPLKKMEQRKLTVSASLQDAQVALKGLAQQAEAVNGGVRVTEKGIADITVSGRFLRGPFAVTTVAARNNTAPTFIASGRVTAAELTDFLHLPGFLKLGGETDWRLTTTGVGMRASESEGGRKTLFNVTSDLHGLSIDLPQPVTKGAAEQRALRFEAQREGAESLLLRGSLGELRTMVKVNKHADGWSFDRAGLRADGVAASLPSHPGLRIEGALNEFTLDDWLKLGTRGEARASGGGKPLNEILRAANVNIGRFRLYGYEWKDVRGVLQAMQDAWRVDVSGPEASGQLLIPYRFEESRPLKLDMEHLALNRVAAQSSGGESKPVDPRDLPALQAEVKDFKYGEHDFGALTLQANKTPQGLQVPVLRASSPWFSGNGGGSWLMTDSGQRSAFNVVIESSEVRSAMRQLNYLDFVEAKRGKLYADLTWPGGLDENWLGRVSGRIEIEADDGQLLNLQPGAGRVLGLLSIAALPRRLSLDFRDLTDKGLRFDTIHGDFNVKDGDAFTENLLLSGPAAEIGIAGRIGFGKRDYDQTAVVTGSLGSSLPVAGTLAGGPVVGAALLLFTQIFKEPLKGVARGYYRITGSWEEPVVERVDSNAAKDAAAESGDTGG